MRFHPFFGGDLETFIRCDLIVRVRFLAGRMFGGLVKSTTAYQKQQCGNRHRIFQHALVLPCYLTVATVTGIVLS
jgi:hypothetical protein